MATRANAVFMSVRPARTVRSRASARRPRATAGSRSASSCSNIAARRAKTSPPNRVKPYAKSVRWMSKPSLGRSSTICDSADSTCVGWRRSISSGGWYALHIICENWRADPASFFIFFSFHPWWGVLRGCPTYFSDSPPLLQLLFDHPRQPAQRFLDVANQWQGACGVVLCCRQDGN